MNKLQQEAANPEQSIWVLASAGTGKTKILTDRILRLLLNDVELSKILCLTFTNVGANEMLLRLNDRLMKWSSLVDKDLAHELNILFFKNIDLKLINKARNLFKNFLELQGTLHVYTIHSFCQKLLKRFPLEAGLPPGFQIMDDILQRKVINKIYHKLFQREKDQELLRFFVSNLHELIIHEIFEEIIFHKLKFKRFLCISADYIAKANALENDKKIIFQNVKNNINNMVKNFQNDLKELEIWDLLYQIYDINFLKNEAVYLFFLTKVGDKRATIIPKKLQIKCPEVVEKLYQLQDMIYEFDQVDKTQKIYNYTNLLLEFARNFLEIYEEYKRERALLDYDDLIYYTNNLLKNSDAKDWVLYKLDGGVDHILIDESQDTSYEQWEIIQNLIEEFYSGQGKEEKNRSLFVVGDEKQSIFSFQGADLEMFYSMNKYFEKRLKAAKKKFKIITLQYSYRSCPAIVEAVYNIFSYIKQTIPASFIASNPKMIPFRNKHYGSVELWPLIKSTQDANFFWQMANNEKLCEPHIELATKIASYIKRQIVNKILLSSTNKTVCPKDFLILVRTRGELTDEIIKQLKAHEIPTAGLDRIIISENLSVLDLLSAAKFVLNPHNDLNLACLLKSPLIDLCENHLDRILINKPAKISLWEFLKTQSLNEDKILQVSNGLENLIRIFTITNAFSFFLYILDYLGGRGKLLSNNSEDDNEAINELLYLARSYTKDTSTSLQGFIYWLSEHEIEVKRSLVSADKVRVMTIHGSKGLEAPIVILCDTTSVPVSKHKFLWNKEGLIASKSSNNAKILQEVKDEYKQKEFEEYLRLLYVALTRPCDHLIICGYENEKEASSHSWYKIVRNAMEKFAIQNAEKTFIYHATNLHPNLFSHSVYQDKNEIASLSSLQISVGSGGNLEKEYKKHDCLIDFMIPQDNNAFTALSSPLLSQDSLKYGKVFHKILEDSLKTKLIDKMRLHPLIKTLPKNLQDRMHKSINNLLNNKEFTDLLVQDIKTELNIGLNINGQFKIGRLDLLALNKDSVTIIDYKSDLNPPEDRDSIPQSYVDQLQSYKEIIQPIYEPLNVKCKILWLQTAQFSEYIIN